MKLTSTILVGLIVGFLKINVVFPFSTGYILQSKVVSPASHVKSLTTSPIIRVPSSTINRFHKHMAVQGSIDDADGSEKTPFFLNPTFQSKLKIIIPVAVVGVLGYLAATSGFSIDISQILESAVTKIEGLGPLGYFYFAGIYILAEVLAIPVMPLTASSGYLFGLVPGAAVVLTSATIAACISFFIGRTLLRDWARSKTEGNKLWKTIDTAVGREGFKIILLLRLSPLLPFAISNYLYGITSVDFGSYFLATLLGFAPGSIGIVYAGSAGKALLEQHGGLPWYAYAGIGLIIAVLGRTVAKIATDAVKAIEAEEEAKKSLESVSKESDEKNIV